MIALENLSKTFVLNGQRKTIAQNVSLVFPTGRSCALLGRNGAGKSTLLKMISRRMDPTAGRILSTGTISWPVGFAGSFHGELTGAQNTRFVARIYGVDSDELIDFVQDFAGLGGHFWLPVNTYSSGMRSRLAFGNSMGIAFDTYLVDEVTAVGDSDFKNKSKLLFWERMKSAGAIIATHSMGQVRDICDCAVVMENGQMSFFDNVEEGIAQHERNMR